MKRGFGSDNHSGISPEVLDAIQKANTDHALAYGEDELTVELEQIIKQYFGENASVFPVFNGTGANVLCLDAMLRSHEAVICAETAHINVDECGAPQRITGARLLTVTTPDGKLTPGLIKQHLHGIGFQHHSQPRVVSVAQSTELGTLYTLEELKTLSDFVHAKNMLLHIDGARLANAAVALGCSFRDMTTDIGADAISFGGTKNGLMMGESVVLLNPVLKEDFLYRRKQAMQLCSKMRFVSAQFKAYLETGLWKRNAQHSNAMAQLLYKTVKEIPGVEIVYPVQVNAVFARLPREVWTKLQEHYFFYDWDEAKDEVRWMCSFDTKESDILEFSDCLKGILDEYNKGE
ncbi:MAG: low specificity L-threonine aldolase [Bacteroidales bacterium]|nr:low specificity L-threonine aldolase [Bacteroidales bacterium]MBR5028956.1 low specificity L-threonine aldolase [Bacteroidales bacterium]